MQKTWVWFLGWEDPLEKEWQPTPVFLPGKSHGDRSLAGYSPWGCKEPDTTGQLVHTHTHTHTHTHHMYLTISPVTRAILFLFFKGFFNADHFRVFIKFVTILLLFYALVFSPWGLWGLSSLTRDWNHAPCIGSQSPTTGLPAKSHFFSLSLLYQLWSYPFTLLFFSMIISISQIPTLCSIENSQYTLYTCECVVE